ncbi:carbon monoxide dehydrogenase subunit G [Actinobacteria bacterium OK074]|nr:carbon monoxide dehydrogenase subunit G [Actinobacteria bacterium OK074]
MEHDVFVPVSGVRLREALGDPVRVARAVPGLQQDAGAEPVAGRVKVRVGGHTITYRGSLRVTGQDDGTYAVEGDAVESRGSGSVKLALAVRLVPAEGGTTVSFEGTAGGDGRVAELSPDAVAAAGTRLLRRFAENLAADAAGAAGASGASGESQPEPQPQPHSESGGDADSASEAVEPESGTEVVEPEVVGPEVVEPGGVEPDVEADSVPLPPAPAVFDADVPAPALDPFAGRDDDVVGPPAEAAHARRTMIGRSAEEVDHSPPRGRYAPVPAPEATSAGDTLRWAAPAAALVVASAIVLGRVLRRRR